MRLSTPNVDRATLENRLLALASSRSFFALYTSRGYPNTLKQQELLFAWGAKQTWGREGLSQAGEGRWRFGYLSYELRHAFERLDGGNPVLGQWPEVWLFEPEVVGWLTPEGELVVEAESKERALEVQAELTREDDLPAAGPTELDFQPIESREEYLDAVRALKAHIQRGDIYEVNYCMAFTSRFEALDGPALFAKMASATDAPFSAYLKMDQHELLCTSPERYLLKKGRKIWSQPIKGTNRRLERGNERAQQALLEDEKERAENVMIVDLVRNDLSRVAAKGSVKVSELFGVYAYKNVNQMISTVEAELREDQNLWEVLRASFPMGSMTGAPKITAMNLAERYEKSAREIYSGAVGYITPEEDFDFNVVIRSIAVNRSLNLATLHVGSAITSLSEPEKEYEECLLKAESLISSAR